MISIKKFLTHNNETEETLMHVVRTLVEGIGQHSVADNDGECAQFRQGVSQISQAIREEISTANLLVHVGSVLKALEDHTHRVTKRNGLQTIELQAMVKMLTSTVGIISSAGAANVSRLGEIEKQVAGASELDDVRVIRNRLSDCLGDIRTETERQRKETSETIQELGHNLERARTRAAGTADSALLDQVTQLPLRTEAEAALTESIRSGITTYAVVMVLDRLQFVNARFGRTAGDEILAALARMVKGKLLPGDLLFRWSGAVFLALLPRANSLELVRSEVNRFMATRVEHAVETPSRSIMIPVVARWTLFPMMASPRLMYQKIDVIGVSPAPGH